MGFLRARSETHGNAESRKSAHTRRRHQVRPRGTGSGCRTGTVLSWPRCSWLSVRHSPGTTSPFTATRYPKAESTDMARSPTPAVVLALRTDWLRLAATCPSQGFVGWEPEVVSGPPPSCRRRGTAVVGSVGRVSVAVFMISPMVGGLRCKLIVYLRRKEVKGIDVEGSRWLRRPSRPPSPGSL